MRILASTRTINLSSQFDRNLIFYFLLASAVAATAVAVCVEFL